MTLWLLTMAMALWTLLPVYVANASAPLSRGWGPRMDLGRTWRRDGNPVLGSSKSWAGFMIGGVMGILVGLFEESLRLAAPPSLQLVPLFSATAIGALFPLSLLGFGAMAGDAIGSFVKRRLGHVSGGRAPFLDQLPFVLLPLLLIWLFYPAIFFASFWPDPVAGPLVVAWVLILSLFLHTSFNWVGYYVGLKKVPW